MKRVVWLVFLALTGCLLGRPDLVENGTVKLQTVNLEQFPIKITISSDEGNTEIRGRFYEYRAHFRNLAGCLQLIATSPSGDLVALINGRFRTLPRSSYHRPPQTGFTASLPLLLPVGSTVLIKYGSDCS